MKLFYITRTAIPSISAQSLQINSMCEAFSIYNQKFKLISPANKENNNLNKNYKWEKIKINTRFLYLEFSIKVFLSIFNHRPTHIYTRDIVIAFIFSFFRIKIFYEAHKEPRTKTAKFLIKILRYKKNFSLITISHALKAYYYKKYNYKKGFVSHDGVFLQKYDSIRNISKTELRKELKLPINKTIVLHTGSLHKGNDATLFKTVVENFPNLLFVHVGGKLEDIKKYKKFYEKNSNIIIKGHQKHDMIVKYQMSVDLLFYALTKSNKLWWCTSPLKIFEYMSTGNTILASNIGSVSEILNNNNSIIYDPEEPQSIIDGINTFFNNPKEASFLSQNALEEVQMLYKWEKRAELLLEYMNER